jgi:hypothetical protein
MGLPITQQNKVIGADIVCRRDDMWTDGEKDKVGLDN